MAWALQSDSALTSCLGSQKHTEAPDWHVLVLAVSNYGTHVKVAVVCRGEVNSRRLSQGYSSKLGSVSPPNGAVVCRGEVNSRRLSQG